MISKVVQGIRGDFHPRDNILRVNSPHPHPLDAWCSIWFNNDVLNLRLNDEPSFRDATGQASHLY